MSALRALAAGIAAAMAASSAFAADEAVVLRQRAEQLAVEDRCDEAIARARRARELAPDDARAALVEGRCLLRQGLYAEAIPPLEAARGLDPATPGVATDLAQCHYHQGDFAAASAELDRAEAQDPDDARMHLYRGLVLLRDSREAEAAEAFDRASALDPRLAEVAGLYSGRSWAAVREREKAAAAFERARDAEPGSEWARAAERELEALDAPYHRNKWLRLRGGVEYDDNPALRVPGSANALNVNEIGAVFNFDERSDVVGVWEGEVGLEFLRDPDRSLGAAVGYQGNAHMKEFHELDLQYPWLSAWYDQRLSEDTWVRLQPFAGYSWLETDPYVAQAGGLVAVSHDVVDDVQAQVYGRIFANDFHVRIPPDPVLSIVAVTQFPGIANDARRRRNRDGVQYDVGTEWTWLLEPTLTTFRFGGAYTRYQAEGKDWSYDGGRGTVSIVQPLPFRFTLTLDGSFDYLDFDHRSSYLPANVYIFGFGPKRRDRVAVGEAELGYAITDWMTLSARYQYTDNESNTALFDYDRHIVGGYLTFFISD